MDIGIVIPFGSPYSTARFVRAAGTHAEAAGFESLWVGEHIVTFEKTVSKYPYNEDGAHKFPGGINGLQESVVTLSFLAAATSKIRLGFGVLLLPQRNPVITALQLATLDLVSEGRLEVGVGLNWCEEEYEALQVPWERRGARMEDYIGVLKTLWCDDPASHSGPYYQLPECRMFPKPVQRPHPRLHIGGTSDVALRRVARFGQGWYALALSPVQVLERMRRLDVLLAEAGRVRGDVQVSMCAYAGQPMPLSRGIRDAYAEAGVDRLLGLGAGRTIDEIKESIDEVASLVL